VIMSGNTILITGGTSGIGFEFAAQLLKLGNTVIITGRDQERLEERKKTSRRAGVSNRRQQPEGDPASV
jgi:uncharacterized oxidoreductase